MGWYIRNTLVETNHSYLDKIKTNHTKATKSKPKPKPNGYTVKLKVVGLINGYMTN